MARRARRYELYLPLTFNDGRPIPDALFVEVERRLLKRFGGLTSQKREFPLRGVWKHGGRAYFDLILLVTALDFRSRGSAAFLGELKSFLLSAFEQLEILITESPLLVH